MKPNSGKFQAASSDSAAVPLLAARAVRVFGDRLRAVPRLPDFKRKSMINTAPDEMQLKCEAAC